MGIRFRKEETIMKCTVCKQGVTTPGHTTVTLERGGTLLVFRRVPADVCANCGEAYVAEAVAARLLGAAEEAASVGVQVDVRELAPALA